MDGGGRSFGAPAPGHVLVMAALVVGGSLVLSRAHASLPLTSIVLALAATTLFGLVFLRADFGLYVLIFSMLLSPEFVLGGGALAERRDVVFRVEDFVLLVTSVAWLARTAINKEMGLVVHTPLNRPIIAYIATHFVSTLIGMQTGSVHTAAGLLYVTKYLEYFFVYYIVANNLGDRDHAWRLVVAALLTAAIVSANGLMQIPGGQRVSAPFEGVAGEPNTFGGYLVLMQAVVAGLALETSSLARRTVLIGLLGLMFVPFVYTLSRASYLAFIPMALTLVVMFPRRRLVLVTVLIAGLALFVLAPPEAVQRRVRHTFAPSTRDAGAPMVVGGVRFDPSTTERLVAWEAAFKAWTGSPIVGFGVTGFRFIDAQYPRTLVETGLVGLAAFAWLAAALLRETLRVCREASDPVLRGLAGGFFAGTIGILVHAVGSNSFIIIRIMEPLWLFAAIVITLGRLADDSRPSVPDTAARVPA